MSIDPEKFGELCGDVKNICKGMDDIKDNLKEHRKDLKDHGDRITKIETEKKWIFRICGSGAFGATIYKLFF